ncbi:MAG: hypothetical protein A2033_09220 [Bacteroidetes bacterium GWA2_31_9]|nr:MAG: hypothetical protein A2033_09220 [Bacteroidetes bacterium GWA2_31_9]
MGNETPMAKKDTQGDEYIKDLATDYTNFTHKSHIFKGIRESLRYVHRLETTFGCLFCVDSKKICEANL